MKFCNPRHEILSPFKRSKMQNANRFFFMIALIKKTTLYKKHRNFPSTWGGGWAGLKISRYSQFSNWFSYIGLFVILNYIYSQLCKLILVPNIHSKKDSYRDRQTQTNKHQKTRKKYLFVQMELNRQRQCRKETDRSKPTIF